MKLPKVLRDKRADLETILWTQYRGSIPLSEALNIYNQCYADMMPVVQSLVEALNLIAGGCEEPTIAEHNMIYAAGIALAKYREFMEADRDEKA